VGDLSKHFSRSEMRCKCGCGALNMNQQFLSKLDLARDIAGIPFVINSGFRCPTHNAQEGGTPDSAHLYGKAADIKADNSRKRFLIIKGLLEAGFDRIGIELDATKDPDDMFIHVDSDETKDPMVLWGY